MAGSGPFERDVEAAWLLPVAQLQPEIPTCGLHPAQDLPLEGLLVGLAVELEVEAGHKAILGGRFGELS